MAMFCCALLLLSGDLNQRDLDELFKQLLSVKVQMVAS